METKKYTAVQRHDEISKYLTMHETISVQAIAEMFHVTTETARKDLQELEKQGIARRFHGGAKLINAYRKEPVLDQRNIEEEDKKWKIAYKAQTLIGQGSKIILDSGSTTYGIAETLDIEKNVTVITNSIPVITLLAKQGVSTLLIGGSVFASDLSTGGVWVDACMKDIYADVAFIGATGIMRPVGPSVEDFVSASAKKTMLGCAKEKYIVADSTKWTISSLVQFAVWEEIDGLIIDDGLPEEAVKVLSEKTKIIIAE